MSREIRKSGKGKFIVGALVGAGVALLFAPKSGKELRKDLRVKMDETLEYAKKIDLKDVKSSITKQIKEIEEDLKSLDKEKVLDIAKVNAKKIEKKAEALVLKAKEAAKPALIELTEDVKAKTVKVLESAIESLEKKEDK